MKLVLDDGALELRLLESLPGPAIRVQYVPPRLIKDRFQIREGAMGRIVETAYFGAQLTDEEKLDMTQDVRLLRVLDEFFTDGSTYTPHVRIESALFVPKILHKSVYGSDPVMPKASRSKGTMVLRFLGETPKERWGSYLTVVGFERAVKNPDFLRFA